MSAPRKLTSARERHAARHERESNWAFMAKLAKAPVHVCLWNKYHKTERRNEMMLSLMGGMDLMRFVRSHRAWFQHGAYNKDRTTFSYWLTAAGRAALRRRDPKHDNAVVDGGLVEPGYQVMPARDFHRDLNEQRDLVRQRAGLSMPTFIRPLVEKIEIIPIQRRSRRVKQARAS